MGCRITTEDFMNLDLSVVKDTVIIPGAPWPMRKRSKRRFLATAGIGSWPGALTGSQWTEK